MRAAVQEVATTSQSRKRQEARSPRIKEGGGRGRTAA
jgi:hypothetical protein